MSSAGPTQPSSDGDSATQAASSESHPPGAMVHSVGPDRLSWLARIGLALARPRWAMAVAGDQRNNGRASSDAIAAMMLLVLSAHLTGVVTAGWIGATIGVGLGVKTLIAVVSAALSTALVFLVISTVVLFITRAVGAGRQSVTRTFSQSFSRAFDLASVSLIPVLLVQLVVGGLVRLADLHVSTGVNVAVGGLAFGWGAALVALAVPVARQVASVRAIPPRLASVYGMWIGRGVLALAAVVAVAQVIWVVRNSDKIRPMQEGDIAPSFELPYIVSNTATSAQASTATWTLPAVPGKPVVVDFWATWCEPCLAAMPEFAQIKTAYGDKIEFVAINLDNMTKAQQLFRSMGYPMRLLFDNSHVADRYGVVNIPHVVVIDATGRVRDVIRGGSVARLRSDIERLLAP